MLLPPPAYPTAFEIMSGSPENSGHLGHVADYMDPVDPRWSNVQPPPYVGVSHSYTPAQHGSAALSPISLADNAYLQARPSPVLSHHSSQDFPYLDETAVPSGLGISSAYQEFAPAPTSSPNLFYQQHHPSSMELYGYGPGGHHHAPYPTKRPSFKRPRRNTNSEGTPPQRSSPVRILPHPEGLHRLEQERRHGGQALDLNQPEPQKSRSSGRGRRDPQAEEEDLFVENLRAQNLSWKIVAEMFRERFGKNTSEARLQMRMLRRRKSAAAWAEADIPLLHEAFNYWQTEKYNIIAAKLQELGATQHYTEEQIKAQLKLPADSRSDDEGATTPQQTEESIETTSPRKRKRTLNDDE